MRPINFLLLSCCATLLAASAARADEWKEVSTSGELTIFSRERSGSSIKELKAVGRIDAPNWVVKNVLDDADHYAQIMPYTAESRILSRDPARHTLVAYARLSPPLIAQRDYTIMVHDEPHRAPDGTVAYESRWEVANQLGPPEKPGVVRVKLTEGSWLLESIEGGQATRATYTLFTDGGGSLPAILVNTGNKSSIGNLFAAIRKAAKDDKYRHEKPYTP